MSQFGLFCLRTLPFSREKRLFDKYQKAARAMPDKKERDEMEALQKQVE